MKHNLTTSVLFVLGILFISVLQAQALTLTADTVFYEEEGVFKPAPDGTAPWLTALFVQDGNNVNLTLTANFTDSQTDNFISEIYLNYEGIESSSIAATAQAPVEAISFGKDSYKADGTGGYFDIFIELPTSNNPNNLPANRFNENDEITIVFSDALVANFDALAQSVQDFASPFSIAAHVQSISTDPPGSTWIGGDADPIPEPTTMLLFGTGLACLTGVIRKKRK